MTLIFLKLGGSLITDKGKRHTHLPQVIDRLANEIAKAWNEKPGMRLILGHGSGSFGHTPAKKYGTRSGVHNSREWLGFAEVWSEARALNQLVIDSLIRAGLPAIAFPPSASILAREGQIVEWNTLPLLKALDAGLIPVLNGDVIFDLERGGTILSTEELFIYLARQLMPERILLAGLEPGVWEDFPQRTKLISEITPETVVDLSRSIRGSEAVDVTGGMSEKVNCMLALVERMPGLEVSIFSGQAPDAVRELLLGGYQGTTIRNPVKGDHVL